MEKQFNYVYLTINKINGKCYIGSHSTDILNDNYLGSGRLLIKAIKKYKKDNFIKIILQQYNTRQVSYKNEENYINLFNTLLPNGYNISPTGGTHLSGRPSIETIETIERIRKTSLGQNRTIKTRENISKGKKGIPSIKKGYSTKDYFIKIYGVEEGTNKYSNYLKGLEGKLGQNKGKKLNLTPEARQKLSEKAILRFTGYIPTPETLEKQRLKRIGGKRSEETKLKMSRSAKGRPHNYDVWNKDKTKILITKEIIQTIKDLAKSGVYHRVLAEQFNYSKTCIARIINGFYDSKIYIG